MSKYRNYVEGYLACGGTWWNQYNKNMIYGVHYWEQLEPVLRTVAPFTNMV